MVNKLKKERRKVKTLYYSKILIIIIIIFVGALFLLNSAKALAFNTVTQSQFLTLEEPVSFLLVGVDTGGARTGNGEQILADAIIILTINPENQRGNVDISMTSVPRDTYVYIPCYGGYDKINASFACGYNKEQDLEQGVLSTKETVEYLFGIEIDHYVLGSFDTLIALVDAIGGITIDVPYAFSEQDSNGTPDAIQVEAGEQVLNGEEALAYSRMRKSVNPETGMSGDDWERNIRQQEVILAIIQKIIANPDEYTDEIVSIYNDYIITDLTIDQILELVNFGFSVYSAANTALSYHNNIQILFKSSDFNRDVAINPYEDMFNIEHQSSTGYLMSEKTDDNSYYAQNTTVFPYYINYHSTAIPSTIPPETDNEEQQQQNDELSTKPLTIEFQMTTLNTQTSSDGYYRELLPDATRYYYAESLAQSTNQETSLVFDETYQVIIPQETTEGDYYGY